MDRDELEERVRQRRPGEAAFRRGAELGESAAYQPFQPEPEDSRAAREEEIAESEAPRVDNTPPGFDDATGADRGSWEEPLVREPEPVAFEDAAPGYVAATSEPGGYPGDEAEGEPYYHHPYVPPEPERGGSGALPLLGFGALAIMALAVGVILAGLLGGGDGVADASPTPSPVVSVEPTEAPTATPEPSLEPSTEATPEPTDGPVAFPDGAAYTVEPCGSYEFRPDLSGCLVDGSIRDSGTVWVLAVFRGASGSDELTLLLRTATETLDQQEVVLGQIVDCGGTCNGLIWAAIYQDLLPGEYELVLRRNGDFADSAGFIVE